MRRVERREQILDAATRAIVRTGFANTSVDDIAAEAGITRVLLYRHFDSKHDLCLAVFVRARDRLMAGVGSGNYGEHSLAAFLRAAAADPDGFRVLYRCAAREPEFRELYDELAQVSEHLAGRSLAGVLPPGAWTDWAARLLPGVAVDAVIAWLDLGQPDPEEAADRILRVMNGVLDAARSSRT
ncbi:TetR/AcrR family transcriptional regulator [Yinghuangia seranimata]|uniref:TetR/AcrR family transcriptional regulator n=1 Tax=Yinghuangia seranimata TaxID=408067 RepID=UPI00248C5CFB|nr:TetR/AcrR family transcriptional regulator [Yinghuangia seranimata]MDI2132341.1 TetR/AcrR family transcriptional regulator [Yinghuangia seranimata]